MNSSFTHYIQNFSQAEIIRVEHELDENGVDSTPKTILQSFLNETKWEEHNSNSLYPNKKKFEKLELTKQCKIIQAIIDNSNPLSNLASWEKITNDCLEHLSYAERSAVQLLRHTQSSLDKQATVLDIGCGKGKVTKTFASYFSKGKVVGIDLFDESIIAAREAFPASHYPNLEFLKNNAESLTLSNEFDIVFSISLLHLVNNPEAVLREAYRVLKKGGGILVVQVPTGLTKSLELATETIIKSSKWISHFMDFKLGWNFIPLEEYEILLKRNHFDSVRIKIFDDPQPFGSREDFKLFLKQWFPFLRKIPIEQQEEFINEIVNLYVEHTPIDFQGCVPFTVRRLEIEARKL